MSVLSSEKGFESSTAYHGEKSEQADHLTRPTGIRDSGVRALLSPQPMEVSSTG